jgi:hypothetical protein
MKFDLDEAIRWAEQLIGSDHEISIELVGMGDHPVVGSLMRDQVKDYETSPTKIAVFPIVWWKKEMLLSTGDYYRSDSCIASYEKLWSGVTAPTLVESITNGKISYTLFFPDSAVSTEEKRACWRRREFASAQRQKLYEMGVKDSHLIEQLFADAGYAQATEAAELASRAIKSQRGDAERAYQLIRKVSTARGKLEQRLDVLARAGVQWKQHADSAQKLNAQIAGALLLLEEQAQETELVERRSMEEMPLDEGLELLVKRYSRQ